MALQLKQSVEEFTAESEQEFRLPDGGTAQVQQGDKVYQTENGWVYHHPAEDSDGNPVTPDWDEFAKGHSNPALVADLLEESDDSSRESDDEDDGEDDGDGGGFEPNLDTESGQQQGSVEPDPSFPQPQQAPRRPRR